MIRILDACEIKYSVLGGTDEISPFGAHSIHFRGTCLANVVNYSNFDQDPTQVLLCEVCGHPGCGSAGWVRVRRIGEDVIWIPPQQLPEKHRDSDRELFPPPYLESSDCGIPVFPPDLYDDLRRQLHWLPDRSTISPLRAREALQLLQVEAPLDVLGRPPDSVRLQSERILAVNDGELDQQLTSVNAFAKEHASSDRLLRVIDPDVGLRPIEFYLDAPRFPAWSAFCRLPDGIGIILRADEPSGAVKEEWILTVQSDDGWRGSRTGSDERPFPGFPSARL